MQLTLGRILYLNLKPKEITFKINFEFLGYFLIKPRSVRQIEPGVYEEIEPPQFEQFKML
jgi:hypothetical protein